MNILKAIVFVVIFTTFTKLSNAQEITMFPSFWGQKYYQDDKEITKKELETLMKSDAQLEKFWKRSKLQNTLATVALVSEFGFAFWTGAEMGQDNDATIPLIGTLGSATIAAIFFVSANNSKRKAILGYNQKLNSRTSLSLEPIGNHNGLGLALKF
ncbi:hypothetical protein RQM65_05465 [Pricia sp. S334]|uniref:Uncharacterized protein n=1 Tax=Pricia mediterranea TaxID=3076079 RepID=A0ABU3L353_9FLAO|nr:hypothetical protein [Pricia sp. S334]MDT7828112.1 hypothetical protein [Pricia sp. S334]